MSVNLSTIETTVRNLLGEYSQALTPGDVFTYSTSSVFTLSETSVISVTGVYQNDVELGSGEYSYDSDSNKVTISASMTSGDSIEIRYTYYPNYSQAEIYGAINGAISFISVNQFYTFEVEDDVIYPEPETKEQNLIAMVAALILEPDNKSYSLPDIRINVPKDLPLHDKISKLIAIAKHNTHGTFSIL